MHCFSVSYLHHHYEAKHFIHVLSHIANKLLGSIDVCYLHALMYMCLNLVAPQ